MTLGKSPLDKITYAVASVAADVFKVGAPLLALSLWGKRFRILATMGFVLWLGCVSWSMGSAVGFVLSSRGEAIADRMAEAATRHGWEARVERTENQLATIGKHRPVDVIKAELASLVVARHIWRRSRHCVDLALEEIRSVCTPVLSLRKELAAAEAAERLEAQLVAGRAQLATVAVAVPIADPQASALASLVGVDEATIRTGVALLLAGLIEAGSALGFTLVAVATARNPPPPAPWHALGAPNAACRPESRRRLEPTDAPERRVQTRLEVGAAGHITAREAYAGFCRWACAMGIPPPRSPRHAPGSEARRDVQRSTNVVLLERWVKTRLQVDTTGRIPAREAYSDFCRWSRALGIEPGTETRFGREFSTHIINLGGAKVKRRDRAYYDGVSLAVHKDEMPAPLRAAA